jgi:hypothetical protein
VGARFVHPLYFFTLPSCFFPFFVFALALNNHLLLQVTILLQVEKASRFVRPIVRGAVGNHLTKRKFIIVNPRSPVQALVRHFTHISSTTPSTMLVGSVSVSGVWCYLFLRSRIVSDPRFCFEKLWPEAPEGEGTRDPWLFWASGALRYSSCNKYNIVYALVKSRLVTIVTD